MTYSARTMQARISLPNHPPGSNLDSFDYCPKCRHNLKDHIERRDDGLSERCLMCDNCGWVNSELIPRIRIMG